MEQISETLWKFMEKGILADENRHDALVYFGRRTSRSTLIEKVHLWGRVLKGMGLKEGDELLLYGPALPEVLYIMLAADMTGVTANLPSLMVKADALDSMVGRSRVAFVFDGLERKIRETLRRPQFERVVILETMPFSGLLRPGLRLRSRYISAKAAIRQFGQYDGPTEADADAGRPAFIFCTSGTSGKGVPNQIGMSDKAMIAMFRNALAFNQTGAPFREGARSYCPLPPFVCTGFFVLMLAPLYCGMTVYLDPRVSPRQFTKNVLDFRPQITLATGAFWVHFIEHADRLIERGKRPDLSFFRFPVMGGEGCTPKALKHINEVMEACGSPVALTSGYGLSETFSVCTVDYEPEGFDKDYSRQAVCVGRPFPGVTVGIFDENDNELGCGKCGEIRVKTSSLTEGYINNPELNQARLKGGWLHTQDIGELDASGKLFVYGRMAQYIVAPGGEKVYLFDIAGRLRKDAAVKDALACQLSGGDHPLVIHVVLEENIPETEEEVLRRLDRILAGYLPAGLRPAGYRIEHGHFRINIVGKIDRNYYSHIPPGRMYITKKG